MTALTKLVLVRHGEAKAAIDGTVAGFSCKGLSDEGRRQAGLLRDRLIRTEELKADVLFASVLRRAVETAEIIAPAIGADDVVEDCDLCELHPGEADGLPWPEAIERFGHIDFSADPTRAWAPGGESWVEFVARVGNRLDRLVREHEGQTVVVACHGGVVDASLLTLLGMDRGSFPKFSLYTTNTSLTEWHRLPAKEGAAWQLETQPRWRLVRYNDAAHLLPDG